MPQINSSFKTPLIKKVDKLAKKNGKSRSETIERLTELGLIYNDILDKQAKEATINPLQQ